MLQWIVLTLSLCSPFCAYAKNDVISVLTPAMQWATPDRITALDRLYTIGGIIEPKTSLKDLYPVRETNLEVVADLLDLAEKTKKSFKSRISSQENWDASGAMWENYSLLELLPQLQILGVIESIYPSNNQVDAMCVLGAGIPDMALRVDFAQYLMQRNPTPYFLLLSGERLLSIAMDGSAKELEALAKRQNYSKWQGLTEMDALRDLVEYSPKKFKMRPEVVIMNTSSGTLPRPTFEMMMREFFSTLTTYPQIKKITFVVNQPEVLYQREIIAAYLKSSDLKYEVVGPNKNNTTLEEVIEGLGLAIWSCVPRLISGLALEGSVNEETLSLAQRLYQSSPELYALLPAPFQVPGSA